jgi:hypothetical protein
LIVNLSSVMLLSFLLFFCPWSNKECADSSNADNLADSVDELNRFM